ncbi:MAG: hypothetical protein AAB343_00390 [Patescibacteria group bacterium]
MNKTTIPRIIRIARALFILSAVAMMVMSVGSMTTTFGASADVMRLIAQYNPLTDSYYDSDWVIHYKGSPTVEMPLESHWLFRQDVGTVVSTEFRRYKPGDVTPYIKIASGKGKVIPVCSDCTNEETDFRDSSQNRIGVLECDPPPPAGVSCFSYMPSRGARVKFLPDPDNPYRTYSFGVDVRRDS